MPLVSRGLLLRTHPDRSMTCPRRAKDTMAVTCATSRQRALLLILPVRRHPGYVAWFNLMLRSMRSSTSMATQPSFADARSLMSDFVPNTPSTEVIEKAVPRLGQHTACWFEQQKAPEDDGVHS